MNQYRLTGDYGTFEIQRTVEAASPADAHSMSGIMLDLMEVGWTVLSSPDGECWTVEELVDGEWVEVDPGDDEDWPDYPGEDEPRLTGHPPNPELEDA